MRAIQSIAAIRVGVDGRDAGERSDAVLRRLSPGHDAPIKLCLCGRMT